MLAHQSESERERKSAESGEFCRIFFFLCSFWKANFFFAVRNLIKSIHCVDTQSKYAYGFICSAFYLRFFFFSLLISVLPSSSGDSDSLSLNLFITRVCLFSCECVCVCVPESVCALCFYRIIFTFLILLLFSHSILFVYMHPLIIANDFVEFVAWFRYCFQFLCVFQFRPGLKY